MNNSNLSYYWNHPDFVRLSITLIENINLTLPLEMTANSTVEIDTQDTFLHFPIGN